MQSIERKQVHANCWSNRCWTFFWGKLITNMPAFCSILSIFYHYNTKIPFFCFIFSSFCFPSCWASSPQFLPIITPLRHVNNATNSAFVSLLSPLPPCSCLSQAFSSPPVSILKPFQTWAHANAPPSLLCSLSFFVSRADDFNAGTRYCGNQSGAPQGHH